MKVEVLKMSEWLCLKEIEVIDTELNEVVYEGLAEDFAEINDYDEELIELLSQLRATIGMNEVTFYDNQGMEFLIKKVA